MRVLVAGGSGFIGRAVVSALSERGDEPLVVSRSPRPGQIGYDQLPEHADAVVNLAGEWVAGLWTPSKKREILRSRIETTRRLVEWMLDRPDYLPVLVNASAVGYYGDRPGEVLTEAASYDPRDAFRGRVCRAWEAEAMRAHEMGARVVVARIGGVLDPGGGLLELFRPLLKHAPVLIPPAADRMFSWISLEDTVRMMLFALDNATIQGPLNVTAPHAATYRQFGNQLAEALGKRSWGSVPPSLLRLLLGENSEALTDSQDVRPEKALDHGFSFHHPALRDWFSSAFESCGKHLTVRRCIE